VYRRRRITALICFTGNRQNIAEATPNTPYYDGIPIIAGFIRVGNLDLAIALFVISISRIPPDQTERLTQDILDRRTSIIFSQTIRITLVLVVGDGEEQYRFNPLKV
jgi:hypothetical protein